MSRTSSELGLLVLVSACGCNAITDLGGYEFPEPVTECGVAHEDCATSILVKGGTFSRSYDKVNFTDAKYTAAVSPFKLDKYEVTVGRFRVFLGDVVAKRFKPAAGDGKHTHVHDGNGLEFTGGYESGWPSNVALRTDRAEWNVNLTSCAVHTWTQNPGENETLPINCITWLEAQAFCIWDKGFLPSEAEWNYAASNGGEQRIFPWGPEEPVVGDTRLAIWGCFLKSLGPGPTGLGSCATTNPSNIAPVGNRKDGNGQFGHADLGGNLAEWTLDAWVDEYQKLQCSDCIEGTGSSAAPIRGGSFRQDSKHLRSSDRVRLGTGSRVDYVGARCARAP